MKPARRHIIPTRFTVGGTRLFVRIGGSIYALHRITPAPAVFRGWRLRKVDGTCYDVGQDQHGCLCTCPDFAFRRDGLEPEGCKHIKALKTVGLLDGT